MPDDLTTPDAPEVLDLPAPNEGEDGTLPAAAVTNTAIARWYAVQVASSCEKKVKATLEQRAVTLGVSNRILEIEIPQTPAVKLKKDGTRQSTEEMVFPGYVLVRMVLDEDTMMAVRSTPNVINFVGAEDRRGEGRVWPGGITARCRHQGARRPERHAGTTRLRSRSADASRGTCHATGPAAAGQC